MLTLQQKIDTALYLGFQQQIDFVAKYYASTGVVFFEWLIPIHPTDVELENSAKSAYAALKTEEIYREQEIRSATVWGKEVDRHFFAWVEELYSKVLKAASRNAIDAANTPITYGLKALRDNRKTLLTGLQAWVDDPAKTAEDIAAFDVSGWSGWSVARPE